MHGHMNVKKNIANVGVLCDWRKNEMKKKWYKCATLLNRRLNQRITFGYICKQARMENILSHRPRIYTTATKIT
jgi:ABC-type proline/glycine betaine transport system ATPase subunit